MKRKVLPLQCKNKGDSKMDIKTMVAKCKTKGLLCFDEPKEVTDLLNKVNEALPNYQVGIKPNEYAQRESWEAIEIVITDKKGSLLKADLYTDRIHIQSDIKKVFAHLFLYKSTFGLYI